MEFTTLMNNEGYKQIFTEENGRNSCHRNNLQYGHLYNNTKTTQRRQSQYTTIPV